MSNIGPFSKLGKKIEKTTKREIAKSIESVAKQSLTECPLDTGALRDSFEIQSNGRVIHSGKNSPNIRIMDIDSDDNIDLSLSYSTKYALIQHENLEFNHPTPGTKAKYLTDPGSKLKEDLPLSIVNEVNKIINNKK